MALLALSRTLLLASRARPCHAGRRFASRRTTKYLTVLSGRLGAPSWSTTECETKSSRGNRLTSDATSDEKEEEKKNRGTTRC
ncbi:hypothetical protein GGS23DRAFT_256105 [Durotheca rogersii]|uniref:uncharacterized protein n=1 Tax=Durotheca rogersii TaxID=419775 RepID=UPI0022207D91|nr:uncharacterized protein GGS23DRAFT_256105 [Durotheca rogersii]KAI5859946.1 hypothetical protein GGS23DRAFT_256105 [Durotheca rogersii]